MTSGSSVFISWQHHRRTSEICRCFGLEPVTLVTKSTGLVRYVKLGVRTVAWLWRHRPRVVVVQNPSIALTALCALLRPLLGFRLLMDAHNEAVTPFLVPGAPMRWLTHWLHKRVDFVIVTNPYLANIVQANGGHPLVLADPLPEVPARAATPADATTRRIVFVSTFASDEPLEEVMAAAAALGAGYRFYVTGNDRKLAPQVRAAAPANLGFTGFLSEDDYWTLLSSADLVVDLTLIDNCLVCGAYESVAAGVPLVLSANDASRDLFHDVAHFTDNTAGSIEREVRAACQQLERLRANMAATRVELASKWQAGAAQFRRAIAPD